MMQSFSFPMHRVLESNEVVLLSLEVFLGTFFLGQHLLAFVVTTLLFWLVEGLFLSWIDGSLDFFLDVLVYAAL